MGVILTNEKGEVGEHRLERKTMVINCCQNAGVQNKSMQNAKLKFHDN